MFTRRKFLQKGLMASAGAAFITPALAFSNDVQQAKYITFDLHAHPGRFDQVGNSDYAGDKGVAKTIGEMNSNSLSGAFFGLIADSALIERTPTGIRPKGNYKTGEAWKEYVKQMETLKRILKTMPVKISTKATDLDKAIDERKVAAFISCEGGDFLDGDASRLDQMYEDGLRSVQLVHYVPNALGDLQTADSQHDGLSRSGKEVVAKMNKLGMVIDVAHASMKTVQDVVAMTDAPIILSHSILKMEESRPLSKRAISIDHAKLVVKTGGVIGAWPSGFNNSFEEFVDNTLRLVEVVGIDHVGLGTDMDGNFKPVLGSYLELPKWIEALQAKGLSVEEVGKIAGGNARRVLGQVLK